jgi:signal peptidase I
MFSVFPTTLTGDKIFVKKIETPYVGEFTKDTIGLNGISGL